MNILEILIFKTYQCFKNINVFGNINILEILIFKKY